MSASLIEALEASTSVLPEALRKAFQRGVMSLGLMVALSPMMAAHATTASSTLPFNQALTFSYNGNATGLGTNNPCCDYVNVLQSAPAVLATTSYSQSGAWGEVGGFASADLATGQLKMRAFAEVGDGSVAPSMQANAIFGDGFRAMTPGNQPFTWDGSSRARFTLNLDGMLDSSRPLGGNSINADAFVILSILNKNTLDPNQPLINGPTAQKYFFWNIGNPDAEIYYTDQVGNHQLLTPTAHFSGIPSTLTADFTPGGDFDWVLLFGASGQIGQPGDRFDLDLSHTLTLSYAGPQGSVTNSISNQFVNFNAPVPAVPEPQTWLMMVGGLGVMTRVMCKRKAQSAPLT